LAAPRRRLHQFLLWLILALAMLAASPASADAQLISVWPAVGSKLETAPSEVVLTFSEAFKPDRLEVRVLNSPGKVVSKGKPAIAGPAVSQALPEDLKPGSYVIFYLAYAQDEVLLSDALPFTILASPSSSTSSPTSSSATSAVDPQIAEDITGSGRRAFTLVAATIGAIGIFAALWAALALSRGGTGGQHRN
jgi:methionine-rich copper-binding protein CopC